MAPHHHRWTINFFRLLGSRSFSNVGKSKGEITHGPSMVKAIESGLVTKEEADKIVSDLRRDLYPPNMYSHSERRFLDNRRFSLDDEVKEVEDRIKEFEDEIKVKLHKDGYHIEREIWWEMFEEMDKEAAEEIKKAIDEFRDLHAKSAALPYEVMKLVGTVVSVSAIGIAVIYNMAK